MPIPKMETTIKLQSRPFDSETDELASKTLSYLQRQSMENLLGELVQEKLHLQPVPGDDKAFMLQHEFYRGQLTAVQYILALDDAAKETA